MGALGYDDPYFEAMVDSIKDEVDLPFMILIGANDSLNVGDCDGNPCIKGLAPDMDGYKLLKKINELPEYDYDYAPYPYWGFPTEDARVEISKDLSFDVSYMYKDDEPLGKFVIFEEGGHMLEDYYATLAWNHFSDFSR